LPRGTSASRAMSASEVAPNPFWYAKPTAALTSRDRLSICVLAMLVPKSVNQLYLTGVGRPVKPPAWFWLVLAGRSPLSIGAQILDANPPSSWESKLHGETHLKRRIAGVWRR